MREKLAKLEFEKIVDSEFSEYPSIPFEGVNDDMWLKKKAYRRADEILELFKNNSNIVKFTIDGEAIEIKGIMLELDFKDQGGNDWGLLLKQKGASI